MKTHGFNHEDANGTMKQFVGVDDEIGRLLRIGYGVIKNGTNANTLKCELYSGYNGVAISETDNIGKGATTGHWTLSADGTELLIENAGLSDYVRIAWGNMYLNSTGTGILFQLDHSGGDIRIRTRQTTASTLHDLTSLVDSGDIYFMVYYIA